jgi:ABC-type Zn uptake system ZnuABC Zn-binding protein ZnuA
MRIVLITACSLAVLALAACGRSEGEDGRLVVATTPQLADFARHVVPAGTEVRALLPENVDPHDFEPRPSDAEAIADADLLLQSGGEVDDWFDDLFDSAGGDEDRRIVLDERIEATGDDPHWWQDPHMAAKAVEAIGATFAEEEAAERTRAYVGEIRRLDRAIERCVRSIPPERRKLVTNHDAFGWFARRYDVEVLGSIIPGRSTSARPSARDVRELVDRIRAEGVRTIFPESALDQRLEEAVARDAGVEVGEPLYADTLGPSNTYVGALRHDAAAIARGLGGDCDL